MTALAAGLAPGLLARLGVLSVDHVAVTTRRFEDTLADYLSAPGATLAKGPGWNPTQKVDYAFVAMRAGLTVEILGFKEGVDSPIESHVRRGGGAYHLCFVVADIDRALAEVKAARGLVVLKPTPDVAFNGRRIAFFMHRAHGLVELVETGEAG
jgi:catechol 2,3-dioxygenase-like lactoylglutathione lyase family enzyme